MSPRATALFFYHPHELTLKGKNRVQFEKALIDNLGRQMRSANVTVQSITKLTGRHLLVVPESDVDAAQLVSSRVFGIANWGKCQSCQREMEVLKTKAVEHFEGLFRIGPIPSFKIETTRIDKRFLLTSPDICREVGAVIHEKLSIPVDASNPAVTFYVEVLDDKFLYYTEKREGALGLPVRTSAGVAVLIGGGFDSPVAAWMMMRRGCAITYVHFHSAPYGEWRSSVARIRKIVQQLALWGGPAEFYAVPIGESQREIAGVATEELRVTLYRMLMMRVAKRIAESNNCAALATGESLGQVASQTIESMAKMQTVVTPMAILRPLLAFCKEEIIARARGIGTYEFSLLPAGDCCSQILPKNVGAKPKIRDVVEGEEKLRITEMVEAAQLAAQLIDVNEPWNEDEEGQTAQCPFTFES
jgi:thiamine biosynthesis protein ThiI